MSLKSFWWDELTTTHLWETNWLLRSFLIIAAEDHRYGLGQWGVGVPHRQTQNQFRVSHISLETELFGAFPILDLEPSPNNLKSASEEGEFEKILGNLSPFGERNQPSQIYWKFRFPSQNRWKISFNEKCWSGPRSRRTVWPIGYHVVTYVSLTEIDFLMNWYKLILLDYEFV